MSIESIEPVSYSEALKKTGKVSKVNLVVESINDLILENIDPDSNSVSFHLESLDNRFGTQVVKNALKKFENIWNVKEEFGDMRESYHCVTLTKKENTSERNQDRSDYDQFERFGR